MTTSIGITPMTLAVLCAGDLLNPQLPVIGSSGPPPSDWVAVTDLPPVGTYRHPPNVAQQWVLEKNFVDPSQIDPQCPAVWVWKCDTGHVWVERMAHRVWRSECPRCTQPKKRSHNSEWVTPEQAIEKVPSTLAFPSHEQLRAALASQGGKTGQRVQWQCRAGWKNPHRPYMRSLSEILFYHRGCPECWKHEHFTPPESIAVGEAFYSFIEQPGSEQETKFKRALMKYLPVDGTVTAVRIADDFFGKPMVHPDVLCPTLNLAIEYDGQVDNHTSADGRRKDALKDQLLREVGWDVIRACAPNVATLSDHDIVVEPGEPVASIASKVAKKAGELRPELVRAG